MPWLDVFAIEGIRPVRPVGKIATGRQQNLGAVSLSSPSSSSSWKNGLEIFCLLHHLNRNGVYVEPVPDKGLVLHCDYTVSESLEAHIILWTMGQWDALLESIGWIGPKLPRYVLVKSRNRYHLPRRPQRENSH